MTPRTRHPFYTFPLYTILPAVWYAPPPFLAQLLQVMRDWRGIKDMKCVCFMSNESSFPTTILPRLQPPSLEAQDTRAGHLSLYLAPALMGPI